MAAEPDPEIQALLTEMKAEGIPGLSALSVEGARKLLNDMFVSDAEPGDIDATREFHIPGPGGSVPIRVYTPHGSGSFPVLLWIHGGGWVLGSLDLVHPLCRLLADETECVVVSIDYRLAPEHPFPAALEDCHAAARWVYDHPDVVHGDSSRIAIGGTSAGANLAAATALLARDRGTPPLQYQVLGFPPTNHAFDTASYDDYGHGYFLTHEDMRWFWDCYLERETDGVHPYASPLQARDLSGLPSATVITCGFDPLRDEGLDYADRLAADGVTVQSRTYDRMIHGFFSMIADPEIPTAVEAVNEVVSDLQRAFGRE